VILLTNNIIISIEYATGYVVDTWDDRMHILINVTSCGTLVGLALTKTAFAVTLLKLTKGWLQWILWFCIGSMNSYMIVKVVLQWARVCGKPSYDVWYRLDLCLDADFRDRFKEGGNAYNIIMDFVLAAYPWIITWNLDMRRVEKIGLCVAMSMVSKPHTRHYNTPLTLCTGRRSRHRIRHTHELEIRRQRERRHVLLAECHVQHLVLVRNRRHHHRPMHTRLAAPPPRYEDVHDV
jgi:hypothetical protein